jgi:hypothetical protein
MSTDEVTRGFLLYFLLPLWIMVAMADWLCHRASRIDETSGTKESLIHMLMLAQAGIALILGLLLEINSLIIALMIIAACAHQVTAMWDVRYAVTRRTLVPLEQSIHSFLDMIPLMAVSFVIILHWPDFLALIGMGSTTADSSLRWKIGPVPTAEYTVIFLAASFVLVEIPYVEELVRCIRADRLKNTDEAPPLTGGTLRGRQQTPWAGS